MYFFVFYTVTFSYFVKKYFNKEDDKRLFLAQE